MIEYSANTEFGNVWKEAKIVEFDIYSWNLSGMTAKRTMKNLRSTGVSPEIRTRHLQNTKLEH
jgi:hypothetical protein